MLLGNPREAGGKRNESRGLPRWSISVALLGAAYAAQEPRFAASAEVVYFTSQEADGGAIWRSDLASGEIEQLIATGMDGRPMMVTVFEDALYWTTYYPGQVWTSGTDGSDPRMLVDQGESTTRGIHIDSGKLYWANEGQGAVFRADLDGTNVERVVGGFKGYSEGIVDFEIHEGRLYWTSWDSPAIRSMRLDGSDLRILELAGMQRAFSIEITGDRLLVADNREREQNRVVSASLEGGETVELLGGLKDLYALDILDGRLYTVSRLLNPLRGLIHSLPLEGGEPRVDLDAEGVHIWQFRIVSEPSQIPGDCSQDGTVDISDALCILGFLFAGDPPSLPCGDGLATNAGNLALADLQGDATVDVSDALTILRQLFLGAEAPGLAPAGEPGCKASPGCPLNPGCR